MAKATILDKILKARNLVHDAEMRYWRRRNAGMPPEFIIDAARLPSSLKDNMAHNYSLIREGHGSKAYKDRASDIVGPYMVNDYEQRADRARYNVLQALDAYDGMERERLEDLLNDEKYEKAYEFLRSIR